VWPERLERCDVPRNGAGRSRFDRPNRVANELVATALASFWHSPFREVLDDQRRHTTRQVAKRVREVRVVAAVESGPTKVSIPIERDLAQQEVAKRVGPVPADRFIEVDPDSSGLAQACPVGCNESVCPHLPRQWQPGRVQDRRPEHAVEPRDVLADHVHLRRPRNAILFTRESRRREIARQCVEPHVDRLMATRPIGEREGDAPVERRPRYRHVLEAALDERENLVVTCVRSHEPWIVAKERRQNVLKRAQPKEPVRLGHPLDVERRVKRTMAVVELARGTERLAADAVPALVRLLVEGSRVALADPVDDGAHAGGMVWRSRTHEEVIPDA
jgi:hypothetical protein